MTWRAATFRWSLLALAPLTIVSGACGDGGSEPAESAVLQSTPTFPRSPSSTAASVSSTIALRTPSLPAESVGVSSSVIGSAVAVQSTTVPSLPPSPGRRIDAVEFIGDSVLADLRSGDDRPDNVVGTIGDLFAAEPGLSDVTVENAARPGAAVVATTELVDGAVAPPFGHYLFQLDRRPPSARPDLAVIAPSHIDLTILGLPPDDVARLMVAELERLVRELDAREVPSVVLPIHGVSGALYDPQYPGENRRVEARIAVANESLIASSLPMLISEFTGLDTDGHPGVDPSLFDGEQERPDGVHPDVEGRANWVANVWPALRDVVRQSR